MSFGIENKVVFISGGAGDIGTAIVEGFVNEKCKIIIGDLNVEAAENVKSKYPTADIKTCSLDITTQESVNNVVKFIMEEYGRIDVLVNVAGLLNRKSLFEIDKSDFVKSMDVNVIGTFLISQAMAKIMKEQKSGTIINISSLNGTSAIENRIIYGTTKAGLNMLTKSMALELAECGITVNAVAPGVVDSVMCRVRLNTLEKIENFSKNIPLGRLAMPKDVSDSVLFLSSHYASYITGEILLVDGGIIARQSLPR